MSDTDQPAPTPDAEVVLTAHRLIYDVVGWTCRCGEWKERRGPLDQSSHERHVADRLAQAQAPTDAACKCPPCPGRGNDGHGMTHCAECCFGTGVVADLDCPTHGDPAYNQAPTDAREALARVEDALGPVEGHEPGHLVPGPITETGWLHDECECGEYATPCPHALRVQVERVRAALASPAPDAGQRDGQERA